MECPTTTSVSVNHIDSLAGSSNVCSRARSNSLSSDSTTSSSSSSPCSSPPPANHLPTIERSPFHAQPGQHIINVVVDQRNYVDINHGAHGENHNGQPRVGLRDGNQPNLAHHQLIIVRGLEANENLPDAARRSR